MPIIVSNALSARGPSAAGCAYDSEDELLIGSQCLTVV